MFIATATSRNRALSWAPGGLKRLAEEASTLLLALLSPAKVIGEVEEMRALQIEADRVEAADPARAAALRRRASRIGLR